MGPEEIAAAKAAEEAAAAKARAESAAATKAAQDAAAAATKAAQDAAKALVDAKAADAEAARKAATGADDPEDLRNIPEPLKRELREARARAAKEKQAREQSETASAAKLAELETATTTERNARLALEARLVAREQDDEIRAAYPKAEALADASVVAHVRTAYADYARAAGADAKDLGAWLRDDAPKSPLLRLALNQSAPGAAARGGRAPDIQRGAGGGEPASGGKLSPEQMRDIASNPRAFAANQERMRKQLEEQYGALGSRPPKAGA